MNILSINQVTHKVAEQYIIPRGDRTARLPYPPPPPAADLHLGKAEAMQKAATMGMLNYNQDSALSALSSGRSSGTSSRMTLQRVSTAILR